MNLPPSLTIAPNVRMHETASDDPSWALLADAVKAMDSSGGGTMCFRFEGHLANIVAFGNGSMRVDFDPPADADIVNRLSEWIIPKA